MGTSTDGILAYGVDLQKLDSSDFSDYQNTDECEECSVTDWGVPCGECYGGLEDYVDAVLRRAGITGVGLIRHCSDLSPMYILGSRSFRARRGSPVKIATDTLEVSEEERGAIRLALTVLEQEQQQPAWLLASDWD